MEKISFPDNCIRRKGRGCGLESGDEGRGSACMTWGNGFWGVCGSERDGRWEIIATI
jgi:hypothetical protein